MSDPAAPISPAKHDPFAAMRHANYRLFAAGFLVSGLGLQMLAMALAWEIYERTNDPLALGIIGLARALPVLLMALPAGYVIDSFDRRRVLVLTQAGFAVACVALAAASWSVASLWAIYLIVTLSGCVRSFNGPTRSSLLPDLVPPEDFQSAVTWNSGIFQVSAIAGPLFAGLIISSTGVAWPVYLIAGILCAAFSATALGLRPLHAHAPGSRVSLGGMFAGMSHLWREKTILAAITLDLFAVLLGGATALLPLFAKDVLEVGPVGLGWLKAAPYLGAAAMAVVLARRPLQRHAGPKMLWSVAGFAVCIIVFGLSTSFWLSLAALVLSGAFDNISVVIRHVLVQVRTPRHLRGRVSAVNSVFIESSNELGNFESGAVARLAAPWFGAVGGAVFSVVSGGLGSLLVVGAVAWLIPAIRRLDRLNETSSSRGSGSPASETTGPTGPTGPGVASSADA